MNFFDKALSKIGYVKSDAVIETAVEIVKKSVGPLIDDHRIYRSLSEILGSSSSAVTQPYKQSVWVYSCIATIVENICRIPFVLKKDAGDLEPSIIESGPIYDLFQNPNPYMTLRTLLEASLTYYCLRGECIWIKEGQSNVTELPRMIWCFDPVRFTPVTNKKTGLLMGWEYNGKDKIYFSNDEVLFFKMFNPYDDVRGISPITAASLSIDQERYSATYNNAFFKNGAVVGGFISTPTGVEFTDDQWNRLLKQFEDRHQGSAKAHKIAVMEGGATFTEAKITQRDMEFIQGKNLTRTEILAAFRVNEVILGVFSAIRCFHPSMEVLTDKGFVNVADVKVGDKLASRSEETNEVSFESVTKVYDYDYDGPLHEYNAPNLSYAVTPEHKMFGKVANNNFNTLSPKHKGAIGFKRVCDIEDMGFYVIRNNSLWPGEVIEEFDIGKRIFERKEYRNGSKQGLKSTVFPIVPFLKFLGWFISEGFFCVSGGRYEFGVSQTKPEGRTQFEKDMFDFPYKITTYDKFYRLSGKDLYYYLMENVGRYSHERRIPREILNLHPSLLRHLFDALMDGDGTRFGKTGRRYTTVSKQLAEDVYELAVRLGFSPTMRHRTKEQNNKGLSDNRSKFKYDGYHIDVSGSVKEARIRKNETVPYKGKVYCFEVPPNHVVFVRRNNKTMWIGQSYEGIKAAHKSFWEECLMPKITYFQDELWTKFFAKLGNRRGKGRIWAEWDIANVGPLQVNYADKIATAAKMFTMGWPINDINKRLQLGMKEVPWGNEWWVPGGYMPVTALEKASKSPPKKEEEEEVPQEGPDNTDAYYYALKVDFENKLKRFVFDQRKKALAESSNGKIWLNIVQEKDYDKLKLSLVDIYSQIVRSGVVYIQESAGELIPADVYTTEIASFVEERASFVIKGFRKISADLIDSLSSGSISDAELGNKLRGVYNFLTSKSSEIARSETEKAFKQGCDIGFSYIKEIIQPSLEWKV